MKAKHPPKYLYIGYSYKQSLFKIGVSMDLKQRFKCLRAIAPDLILIGYKKFNHSRDARKAELEFFVKWPRPVGHEWLPYSPAIIEKFASLKGSVCDSLEGIKEIKFPKQNYQGWIYMQRSKNKEVMEWRLSVGYQSAIIALMENGVAQSTAEKLLTGNYKSEPKQLLLNAIESAMKGWKK